jgi:hypothetical protein
MEPEIKRCGDLCSHKFHPFLYILDTTDKSVLIETGDRVNDIFYAEAIKTQQSFDLVRNVMKGALAGLCSELTLFFTKNSDDCFFIRMNTISPKDASMFMSDHTNDEWTCYTEKDITNDINYLKVGVPIFGTVGDTVERCIQLICHSERVNLDLKLFNGELSILLLPWVDIKNSTETRCYIKSGKLLAISQYYEDLVDCYDGVDMDTLYDLIISFFESNRKKLPQLDVTMDLHIKGGELFIIEYNNFTESDKCLFTSSQLDLLEKESLSNHLFKPPFRYWESTVEIPANCNVNY